MMWKTCLVLALACPQLFSADGPKGTVPRISAVGYPTHAQGTEVAIGATLLRIDQVRQAFVSDVNHCCIVVEVALYPTSNKTVNVSLNDFALRVSGKDVATKPSSTDVVAAMLRKNSGPSRTVNVAPSFGVGYQSGIYDPVNGPQAPGPIYQGGVNVSTSKAGARPGSTEKDLKTMETELSEKGLPEGQFTAPISGYMYFPYSSKKKCTNCQLEYLVNGTKLVLSLP